MKLIQDIFKKIGPSIEPYIPGDGLNSTPIGQTTPAAGSFTSLGAPVGRCATLVVAASDSSALSKQQADYVCDGTADDVEIQAAIDALPVSGGKVVLMEGTFLVSLQTTLHSLAVIHGQGDSTVVKIADSSPSIDSVFEDNTDGSDINWEVAHIKIDGNKANVSNDCRGVNIWGHSINVHDVNIQDINGQDGIVVNSTASVVTVRNCFVKDVDDMGIEIIDGAEDVNVIDCTVDGSAGAANFSIHCHLGKLSVKRGRFINCHSLNAANKSFRVSGLAGSESEDCAVINCDDHNPGVTSMYVDLSKDTLVSSCSWEGDSTSSNTAIRTTYNGCKFTGSNSVYGPYSIVNGCTINGGILSIYGDHVSVACLTHNGTNGVSNFGIMFYSGANYGTLVGSSFFGEDAGARTGIWLRGAQHCSITGNVVNGWTSNGINLSTQSTDPTHNLITGNIIEGCGTGINESVNGNHNLIQNNSLIGNTIPISKFGNDTVITEVNTDLLMDTLAVSATHIRSNEDLSAATPMTFTLDAQPDIPRTLSWSFDTHAQITEYDMEVIGIDAKGNTITETWDETAGWSGETSTAFATITSIKMTSRTGTGVADTMDIGITDVLGLSNVIYGTSDVFKIKKNNTNATVATAQVNTTYDTYDMSVIGLGAGDDFTVWYKSNLNIIS